jgi:Rrf2 family iron-sulfur cluster assembly transcriptional regulator
MRLTTRGRYAVAAMLDLAMHEKTTPVCLADIAKRQGISRGYLEQLFSKLKKQDLVVSSRGPGGGYRLSRNTLDINIAEIISAVNESIDATSCNGAENCNKGDLCLTHQLWDDLSMKIHVFLCSVSLDSRVQKNDIQLVTLQSSS